MTKSGKKLCRNSFWDLARRGRRKDGNFGSNKRFRAFLVGGEKTVLDGDTALS